MVIPFSRVQKSGFDTGHFMVSNAACIMKRNKTGPSHEPFRTPIEPAMKWGRATKKAVLSNDLPIEFVKWRENAADRNRLRSVCGSKMPSETQEMPTTSRQYIWAEL
jgi:hypothetical protein